MVVAVFLVFGNADCSKLCARSSLLRREAFLRGLRELGDRASAMIGRILVSRFEFRDQRARLVLVAFLPKR